MASIYFLFFFFTRLLIFRTDNKNKRNSYSHFNFPKFGHEHNFPENGYWFCAVLFLVTVCS